MTTEIWVYNNNISTKIEVGSGNKVKVDKVKK